jgi:deoxyribonuclease V
VTFPYVPGLLAFRELPALLEAIAMLKRAPDVIIVDGHGYAHPRRFGITCHLGVLLDVPTIGCAKSILVGDADPPENHIGASTPLIHKGDVVGSALRSKLNTKPLFVSIGHRVSLQSACALVLNCCRGYRLPEPTRLAHQVAGGMVLEIDDSSDDAL